ncbi:MAG: hypothetical protein Q8K60_03490, partial [Parachlamydiaceae bacterium]|nr:hypothetical protein [Parachlamydiaceae bacterium]
MTLIDSITKPLVFFYQNLITQPIVSFSNEIKFDTLKSIQEHFSHQHYSVDEWLNYSHVVKEKIKRIFINDSEHQNELNNEGLQQLNEFLTQVIEKGFSENIEKTLFFITECVEFKYLEKLA